MREVAIVGFAQSRSVRRDDGRNEVEMLLPVVAEAIARSGIPRKEIGFTISGSSDFLSGVPFSFVSALDAVGAWPPIEESHVEMDGAFALYEAWVRLQHGDIDSALVYAFGKSSMGNLQDILVMQLDPYYQAPLFADPVSLAALQARALLATGRYVERDFAEVAMRSRRSAEKNANANANAQVRGSRDVSALLSDPYLVSPLRKHDLPPISDGAAAVVLASGKAARRSGKRPAFITGIDHRIEAHALGLRDLTLSPSTTLAARKALEMASGGSQTAIEKAENKLQMHSAKIGVAELHAPFTHQELILRDALAPVFPCFSSAPEGTDRVGEDRVAINPSGGALSANPLMSAGLIRIGEAATRVMDGEAERALAHATSGPCLQQNLVCILDGRSPETR